MLEIAVPLKTNSAGGLWAFDGSAELEAARASRLDRKISPRRLGWGRPGWWHLLALSYALVLSGCSKREAVPVAAPVEIERAPAVERGGTAELDDLTQAIVTAALQNRNHTAQWDGVVRDLARRYAFCLRNNRRDYAMSEAARDGVARGCRDPFVRYVFFRHRIACMQVDDEAFAREGQAIAEEMGRESYPALLRAYVSWRAYLAWNNVFPRDKEREVRSRLNDLFWHATFDTVADPAVPEWMARLVAGQLDALWRGAKDSRDNVAKQIDSALGARFGDCATVHYLRAARAIQRAWEGRGVGHADTVTKEGAQVFKHELEIAYKELGESWQLAPNEADTAEAMITVCMGLGLPQEDMEQWFQRGLATGQDASELCEKKHYSLAARWGGSLEKQLAFSRECLAHPEYGWTVTLLLWDTHQDNRTINNLPLTYYAQPEVWADIKQSLSAYLERFPESVRYRMFYAYHAWLAQDWSLLKQQLTLVDPAKSEWQKIGGRKIYDQMLADVKARAGN